MRDVQQPLMQTATAPGAAQAPADINSTEARPEPLIAYPEGDGDLPQGMSPRTTLLPGIDTFRLPDNLAQLWHDIEAVDTRPYLPSGQPNPTKGLKFKRRQLKFDRNAPLVVVGGKHDGDVMTATFSTAPRPRGGKGDDPKTPWISDATLLLDVSLNDKSRPADPKMLEMLINKYAGKTVRLDHGLTTQCRPDKVRYIRVAVVEDGKTVERDIQDPTGAKGCGKRYYTPSFKNAATGGYDNEIACDCSTEQVTVVLRGFEQVDRFLPPLGS